MFKRNLLSILGVASMLSVACHAATITVNSTNSAAVAGKTNLTQAINMLHDGDTIAFNIPTPLSGSAVYIPTPNGGYPIITNNNVTVDGYTQTGASPNTNPIHAANNAKIRICLDSRNGYGTSMGQIVNFISGPSRPGFGDDEWAVLGVFGGTNVHIRGLAILSAPTGDNGAGLTGDIKSFSFARSHDVSCANWHVSGCWIGVDPATGQVAYLSDGTTVATPVIAIAAYRHRDVSGGTRPDVYPQPGIIGVAAGSANPRAEFNVIVTGYGFDSEGLNFRISGNFWGVLPDGVTSADMSVLNGGTQLGDGFIEIGRNTSNLTIGTDGDGVNDADEGNVFGGFANGGAVAMDLYSSPQTNIVIAGNWFGVGVDGSTRFTNKSLVIDALGSQSTARIGSDFDGVSDALEANVFYNNNPFAVQFPDPATLPEPQLFKLAAGARVSFRGNVSVNNGLLPFDFAGGGSSRLIQFTNYESFYMATNADIVPVLSTNSSASKLIGTAALGAGAFTNITYDVYLLDQEGWTNGMKFLLPELMTATATNGFPDGKTYLGSFTDNGLFDSDKTAGNFSLDISSLNLSGQSVTVTANYSSNSTSTHNAPTHTSNFSNPINIPVAVIGPRLSVAKGANKTVVLSWPSSSTGFVIQSTAALPGTWADLSPQPSTTTSGGTISASISIGTANAYYRLKK